MRPFSRSVLSVSIHSGRAVPGTVFRCTVHTRHQAAVAVCCTGPSRAMDGAWGAPMDGPSVSGVTCRHLRRNFSTAPQASAFPPDPVARPIARATTDWVDTSHWCPVSAESIAFERALHVAHRLGICGPSADGVRVTDVRCAGHARAIHGRSPRAIPGA